MSSKQHNYHSAIETTKVVGKVDFKDSTPRKEGGGGATLNMLRKFLSARFERLTYLYSLRPSPYHMAGLLRRSLNSQGKTLAQINTPKRGNGQGLSTPKLSPKPLPRYNKEIIMKPTHCRDLLQLVRVYISTKWMA